MHAFAHLLAVLAVLLAPVAHRAAVSTHSADPVRTVGVLTPGELQSHHGAGNPFTATFGFLKRHAKGVVGTVMTLGGTSAIGIAALSVVGWPITLPFTLGLLPAAAIGVGGALFITGGLALLAEDFRDNATGGWQPVWRENVVN